MKDLPLHALRAFAAVHETGGVRSASRLLGVAHSSVSRHVTELEAWLGVALFEPDSASGRSVLTPQGRALGAVLAGGFGEMAAAVDSLRERRRGNNVTLGTTASVAARWLLPRLPRFQAAHPWVELSVVIDQQLREPGKAGVDLNLRMGRGPWPGLRCEPLMGDELFPVMAAGRWAQDGRPTDPGYVGRAPLLHDRDPQVSWSAWRKRFGPKELDTRDGARFGSSDLVLRAAAQGLGMALARGRLAEDDLASGALVRPFGDRALALPDAYWIVLPDLASERSAVTSVLSWLRQEAAEGRSL